MKPLGRKAYGSIAHLVGSRAGKTDKYVTEGQTRIATIKPRDQWDTIVIQEKIDGSCCAIAKINGVLTPLTRSGNLACRSIYPQHQAFYYWVMERADRFAALLEEGERLVGEWLALAHGTRYTILSSEEVFRAFDLMFDSHRLTYEKFMERVAGTCQTVPLLSYGPPHTPEWCMDHFPVSGAGAERVEGYVYRVERHVQVDFLAKWVRPDYEPGCLLPEFTNQPCIWNWKA
jgi:hypothetical protein